MVGALLLLACAPESRLDDRGWVRIRGGEFQMGDPEARFQQPVHTVTMETFWIRQTETTVAEWALCVEEGACEATPEPEQGHRLPERCNWGQEGREDHPINCITWFMARDYCRWAGGHLPSESQWEYAARSRGQERTYPWGEAEPSCELAHYKGCEPDHTEPVCTHPEGDTEQGLCDMAGNAYEWTLDSFQDTYDEHPIDGRPLRKKAQFRSLRGGAVGSDESLSTDNRVFHEPDFFYSGMGFRCAVGGW